jgi:hypothetical protein
MGYPILDPLAGICPPSARPFDLSPFPSPLHPTKSYRLQNLHPSCNSYIYSDSCTKSSLGH